MWEDDPQRGHARTDAAGEFRFYVPVPGALKVWVEGDTVAARTTFVVTSGEHATLQVDTRPARCLTEVTGVVLDAATSQRLPLAQFERVVLAEGDTIWKYESGDVPGGSFRLRLSSQEGSTITFKSQGHRPRTFEERELVAVRSGFQVALEPASFDVPRVRIELPEGLIMPDVVLFDAQTREEIGKARYVTETEYDFAFAGRNEVLCMVSSLRGYTASPLLCTAGGPSDIRVELTPGGGRIEGVIRDDPRGTVYLRTPDGLHLKLQVDSNGRFASQLLPPGTYHVSLDTNRATSVQVDEGEKVMIEL
jgi:hypothetical protein